MAHSSHFEDKLNLQAIKGLYFFGVPSQGMDITTLIANGRQQREPRLPSHPWFEFGSSP